MELINLIFIKLQAPNLLVSVQAELLDSLMVDISMMLGISSWEAGEGAVLGELCLRYGRWCVDYMVVHKFLQGLGMYTWHMLEVLDVDMTEKVLESIGNRVGIRSGQAWFTPLDRVDRLKVGPRIDSDRPDRFRVGKYSKVNRSDRFENEMGPTRVPSPGMKREVNFLPSYNIDSHFNCSY